MRTLPPPTSCQRTLVCCTGRGCDFVRVIVSPRPHRLQQCHIPLSSIAGVHYFLQSYARASQATKNGPLSEVQIAFPWRTSVIQLEPQKGRKTCSNAARERAPGPQTRCPVYARWVLICASSRDSMSSECHQSSEVRHDAVDLSLPWSSPQSPCSDLAPPLRLIMHAIHLLRETKSLMQKMGISSASHVVTGPFPQTPWKLYCSFACALAIEARSDSPNTNSRQLRLDSNSSPRSYCTF